MTDRKGIANISACIEVPNDCHLECRIDPQRNAEFTFGTWEGGAELHMERYALERFLELATWALNEPAVPDSSGPPLMMISPGSSVVPAPAPPA